MRLPLYSSTTRGDVPNLVGLQDEAIHTIPTILVCPIRVGLQLTPARFEVAHGDRTFIACPELTRPIRRAALRPMGRLSEALSSELMRRFLALLAR